MSLVAYGDSDDGSSDSETEEISLDAKTSPKASTTTAIDNVKNVSNSEASIDIKPSSHTEKRSKLSSLLPKPQKSSQSTIVIHSEPQKKLLDLKAIRDEDEDEIIDVEEEYVPLKEIKKKSSKTLVEKNEEQKSVGSLFSRMPSPWSQATGISLPKKRGHGDDLEAASSSKKGKHPVRIVAPTLVDADSDDESDEKKVSKTAKQSKSGSGLSSLLPKPKHSVTLTASNPNKPTVKLSNRALIPHTLTKKPTSKETKTTKKTEDGKNSDDEEEPVSFFTFNDKNDVATKGVNKPTTVSEPTETVSFSSSIKVASVPEVIDTKSSPFGYEESRDEPLGVSDDQSSYSYGNTSDADQYSEETTTYYQPQDGSQPYDYGSYDQSAYTTYYDTQPTYSHYQETVEPQIQDIDIGKMQRLQGRKNRNEQINIIDINAADQTADAKVQLTNLTAEQFAHKSSKKQGNMPSSQQRRKHQITYLAFQAKEREFELQQQWASNRQTKRQTQAKYGF